MSRFEFEQMLRFKAQAGIVPLVAWVRELADEYIFGAGASDSHKETR